MIILKSIIAFIVSFSSIPSEQVEEWFPVLKPKQAEERSEELDASIWVLFSKDLGSERFWVRFPDEPSYQVEPNGDLVVQVQKEGEIYRLTVRKGGERQGDRQYPLEGMWAREHWMQTQSHLYHFETLSFELKGENHQKFISSLFIEEKR